jgi:hypothetical protein
MSRADKNGALLYGGVGGIGQIIQNGFGYYCIRKVVIFSMRIKEDRQFLNELI